MHPAFWLFHLHLTDADIGYFDSRARLSPPLRQQRDRDALREALADGTIDVLVSDHNPVEADAKNLPFAEAEPGATGLELLLSLALKWGEASGQSLPQTLRKITCAPASVLGASLGTLQASFSASWSPAGWPMSACLTPMPCGVCTVLRCKAKANTHPLHTTWAVCHCRVACAAQSCPGMWPTG